MHKVIWTCWFQGREMAPPLVKRCIESWEKKNPEWELRCLDASTIQHYVDLKHHVNLEQQTITSASLSDILRILLLHEYGGVWVDATTFCQRALDTWLPEKMAAGFFAFEKPGPDRALSSWFLASVPGNEIIEKWCAATLAYWNNRARSEDYFWFHNLFGALLAEDCAFRATWDNCMKESAVPPHAVQRFGMFSSAAETASLVDWETPVFKLTYRVDIDKYRIGCLLHRLIGHDRIEEGSSAAAEKEIPPPPLPVASLKVSTENLGDHIQIIAAHQLQARHGITPEIYLDRDNEIASAVALQSVPCPVGILMNGWHKTNRAEWPPHPKLRPAYLGFHIRLFQCPELTSDAALDHYRLFEPIGCRDSYTSNLLKDHGIDSFISHCLTLTFPRRAPDPIKQNKIFLVSRDERLAERMPQELGEFTFVSHYSGSNDFEENMQQAGELLEMYRDEAKLIVTSLLHCALPAIAMGIPVIMISPINTEQGSQSDRERFSSLSKLIPIYHPDTLENVNWDGDTADVAHIKLSLIDHFQSKVKNWHPVAQPPIAPIAPSYELPVPSGKPPK